MNVLFLSISYKGNSDGIYTDLVKALTERGHNVTVVTSAISKNSEDHNLRLIGIGGDNKTSNLIQKGLNTLFIGNKFKKNIKKYLKNNQFDIVIYATPPITLNTAVNFCKKQFNAITYLMLKDIFPQNAVDLNMFGKNSPLYYYFRHQERRIYAISDYIGCMSQGNVDYLLKNNPEINPSKVELFFNSIQIKKSLNEKMFSNSPVKFLFGGNLGRPQNIEGLLKIVKKLDSYDKAQFIIVGKGTEKDKILKYLEGNSSRNLKYYDFLPSDEYEAILHDADVGIISLDPRFTIPNIPSKLPVYMNYKKPILALTDINTDLKSIIESCDCGWWLDARDEDGIISEILDICEHPEMITVKGNNGFNYLIQNYDVNLNIEILEEKVKEKSV